MAYRYHIDPPSSRIEPPVTYASLLLYRGVPANLPYAEHPLYIVRKIHIMDGFTGIFLLLSSNVQWHDTGLVTFTTLSILASILLCALDLYTWAYKKAAKPEEDPVWPLRKFMVADLILTVILLSVFIAGIGDIAWNRGYNSGLGTVWRDYGYLATLVCSCLHALSFWKQLMALYQRSWLASLQLPLHEPCQRCGYALAPPPQPMPYQDVAAPRAHMHASAPVPQYHVPPPPPPPSQRHEQQQQRYHPVHPQHLHQPPSHQPPNLHPYIGPSAVLTPSSHASPSLHNCSKPDPQEQLGDGLLIGPGYEGSRYQDEPTIAAPPGAKTHGQPVEVEEALEEPVLEEPVEVVVGTKAGKRRER